jgi:signal transduction histidine kinase
MILPQYLYWYPIAAIGFSLLPYLFFDFDREKISFWAVLIYHLLVAVYIPVYLHTGEHSTPESRVILTTVSYRAAYGIILLLVNLCVLALVSINKFYEAQISALNNSLEKIVEKRTAELMERNAQLSQYAYMNSHKVRGPLARILGLLSLMKEEIDENEKSEIQDKLYKAAQELDVVVSDMNKKLNE